MLSKMVAGLKSQFLDDTTSNSNSLSNAWNYLHMTVDGIILFTIYCITHLISEMYSHMMILFFESLTVVELML